MPELPAGTVTFLFTDIEGSTRLWELHPGAMEVALARHDSLAAEIIHRYEGRVVKHRGEGDSLFAVFARAADAVGAAAALQQALWAEAWPTVTPLRVRLALHTGEAAMREGDYLGPAVNRCARLRAAARGGQVLLSAAAQERAQDDLPAGVSLRDLGLHRLRDLHRAEHIFQLLHPDLPAEFPPLQSLDALPNNLPQQVTRFVGREREMEEIRRLLGTTRLLTLTGAGGTGKTRLALQVAADLLPEYPDGIWLVELAPLSDPALVPQTVAAVLLVREEPGKPLTQTLVDSLKPKRLLLLLDNCEHLLSACAALADALQRGAPKVQILATSREGLNIPGEQTHRIPSLSLPDPRRLPPAPERLCEYEAVRLFLDRAVLAQSSFALTEQNAPAVAQICHRLDGIPLALELAAARVKALPAEKIAERLTDRFRLLTGGSRTALPRQQTLRALIDWSYDLLSPSERALLRRRRVPACGTFAGGWPLEAAEAVCAGDGIEEGEVLDRLTMLVDKSLVMYGGPDGDARYRLLETVRQYAQDRLQAGTHEVGDGEAAGVRERHRDWFLALAEEAEEGLPGESQRAGMDRLEREHDNLRAALAWCVKAVGSGQWAVDSSGKDRLVFGHDPAGLPTAHCPLPTAVDKGLRLGAALWGFWDVRGYWTEGRAHLAGLLALPGAEARTAARARALHGAGLLAWLQGDAGAARARLEEGLALFRELEDRQGIAGSLGCLGSVARFQGDSGAARMLFGERLALCRELGDKAGVAWSLCGLGTASREQGEHGTARGLFVESLAIFREVGDKDGIAWSLTHLGRTTRDQGEYGAARAHLEESLAIFRELGDKRGIARSLGCLGIAAGDQGDQGTARAWLEESLAICREVGDKQGIVTDLEGLAAVALEQAQFERAARLFGTAEGLRELINAPVPPAERAQHDRSVAAVRTALGDEAFAAAWAAGEAMSLDEAVAFAREESPEG